MSTDPQQYWPELPGETMAHEQEPVQREAEVSPQQQEDTEYQSTDYSPKRTVWKYFIYVAIAFAVVAFVYVLSAGKLGGFALIGSNFEAGEIDESGWQAVFLANDQVYFGKLSRKGDIYILTNIYYLQVDQPLQAGQDVQDQLRQPDIRLIKLGDELHGPDDKMYLVRSNVLYWENLKEDSRVVQSIRQYEAQ